MGANRRSKDGGDLGLPGFEVLDRLYASEQTAVFRAVRVADHLPVVLKTRMPGRVTSAGLGRCRYEYEVIRRLDAPGITKAYDLVPFDGSLVLVLEDCGGESLGRLLRGWKRAGSGAFSVPDFYLLADKLLRGLAAIHGAGIVHKDICPSNIVYNPTTGELRIIDFDIAAVLDRERPLLRSPHSLEGTLAYLSPEQTGRVNRTVDYRSDYYSLGVTFYELLTGTLPFEGADAIEIVHHHIASTPVEPRSRNPLIPEPLSSLVLKLMAKAPEDRYQSAHGIRSDLEALSRRWRDREVDSAFKLGRHDRAERFTIPEKLYGRQHHVRALLAAFEAVAEGKARLVTVSGSSGIGKTSVVNEIHRPILRRRGYFVRGKFDALGRGVPFSAITQAMRELVEQLLGETPARLARQKADILGALGDGAQAILDVVPELERVIGPQPEVPALSADAARNRFTLLFRRFADAIATADHPLVLFLDDLQWADAASLELTRILISERPAGHLLIVGAFRDNEVTPAHPLRLLLEDLARAQAPLQSIPLDPLPLEDVTQLVADALGCSMALALPLAALVHQKTGGNPFFTRQFLVSLYKEKLIAWDGESGSWQCDIARVSALALSADVAALMSRRLQKLPDATREALELAACIGSTFDLETLAAVRRRSRMETAADLWSALQEGLIVPRSEAYRFYSIEGEDATRSAGSGSPPLSYAFLHDRVRQAAYELIPSDRRTATHLRTARLMLESTPEADREARIFDIVNQFNRGFDAMADPAERLELARLDLLAGRKAKGSTAYRAARDYFSIARRALPEGSWQSHFELTRELYEASVEAAFLTGDFDEMEGLARTALARTPGILDQIGVHEVRVLASIARNDLPGAVRLGRELLKSLGTTFPEAPSPEDIAAAMREVASGYAETSIAGLAGLPPMTDPGRLATMRLLAAVSPVAYLTSPALYALLILRQVQLSIRHGNTAASSFAYASYGLILCASVDGIDAGHRFGRLALELMRKLDDKRLFCQVPSIVASFVTHWRSPVTDSVAQLRSAYATGQEIGDFQFAAYSAILTSAFQFIAGTGNDLPGIRSEASALMESVREMKQTAVVSYFEVLLQALHDAVEGRASCELLQGEICDEQLMIPRYGQTNDRHGPFYISICKLILSVLYGDYEQALVDSSNTESFMDALAGMPYAPVFCLYDSLARMAAYRLKPRGAAEEALARVDHNLAKLKTWAEYAPMNCDHRCSLVIAERHRLRGERARALAAYDRAMAEARRDGFPREEALANELAAEYLLECGDREAAAKRVRTAIRCYSSWGAEAKSARLERDHAALLAGAGKHEALALELDISTIVKASLAISGEIDLGRLAVRLMDIAMESAGAQRGALVMEREGDWMVEAVGEVDTPRPEAAAARRLSESDAVSAGIITRVASTKVRVVLEDAAGAGEFSADPYVTARGVRSVLCMPLLNAARISGILYLENNLVSGAFVPERMELLDMLSAQMALALDNAVLYRQAQQEIAERARAASALLKSEERFRTIFDSVNDAIFVQDLATGDILDVNQTMCAMYGYTREEALQVKIGDLSSGEPPYTQREAEHRWTETAEKGPQVFEWRARRKDGGLFWAEVSMRRASIDGQDRLLVVVRDTSERKRVEEELRASEAFLDSIIEHSPYATWVGDATGTLIRLNQQCRDILHITDEEVVGVYNVFDDPQVKEQGLVPLIRRVFDHGETVRFAMFYDIKQPTGLTLDMTISPVLDERGTVVNIVTQHFDITDMKRAEEQVRRLNEELERRVEERTAQLSEANRELESFSYSVSHDLRAPLRAVDGFTHILVEDHGPRLEAEGRRLCGLIQESSRRMGRLIDDLLAFSRLGRAALLRVRIDMAEMARQVVEECAPPGERGRLDVRVSPLPVAVGDRALIRQVWVNLVSNAVKFSSRMEEPLVEIGFVETEGEGSYFVRDNGAGFDMRYAGHLFGVFQRLHGETEFPGTGVGLAIVQRIVHRHGGRVWATAEPDKGATFRFSLPEVKPSA